MKYSYKALMIIVVFLSLAAGRDVLAQAGVIRGKVVDGTTGKALEYAYILNYSLQKNIYCNSGGEFRLDARPGDTLVMYALGYYYMKVIVDESILGTQQPAEFSLRQQAYELSQARILAIGTYEDFKQQFIALDLPKTETDNLNEYIAGISHNEAREAFDKAMAERRLDGVTFATVPILTPEEKERIKLARIIEKEQVRDQVYQKYNPVLVKKVTGLSDDDEIIQFMAYCDFSDKYLLEVNEYDLMTRIGLKFEMYKRHKQDKKHMDNPLNRIEDTVDHLA